MVTTVASAEEGPTDAQPGEEPDQSNDEPTIVEEKLVLKPSPSEVLDALEDISTERSDVSKAVTSVALGAIDS